MYPFDRLIFISVVSSIWNVPIALPTSVTSDPCPKLSVGVHRITAGSSNILIAVAKSRSLLNDEESYILAADEARLKARYKLIKYLAPKQKYIQLSGVIDISVCRSNGEIFATIKLDAANVKRAFKIQELIYKSMIDYPTLQP